MAAGRPQHTDTKPWYKQFWPWLVIFFPSAAVVAGIATVVIAVKSNDGLVEDEYYKKGLLINFSKEMDRKAGELGLSGYVRLDTNSGELYLLIEQENNEIDLADLQVTLKHATRSNMDQQITVQSLNNKEFRGAMESLAAGKWHVLVESADTWRLTGTIQYPDRFDSRLLPAPL